MEEWMDGGCEGGTDGAREWRGKGGSKGARE